jgi:hypothetical protein
MNTETTSASVFSTASQVLLVFVTRALLLLASTADSKGFE